MIADKHASMSLVDLRGWAREVQTTRWSLAQPPRLTDEQSVKMFGETLAERADQERTFIASFEGEIQRRVGAGLLTQHDANVLLALSRPAPEPPSVQAQAKAVATRESSEERAAFLVLAEATVAVLRELNEAKSRMTADDQIDQLVITRAAQFAADQATKGVQQRSSGDVTLIYDKNGRLTGFSGPNGETHLVYDLNGKLLKIERPRLDA